MSKRRETGEGGGMGGSQLRDRFDKREERMTEERSDIAFRDRPEIREMRERAERFRKSHRPGYESPEAAARRLKLKRGRG